MIARCHAADKTGPMGPYGRRCPWEATSPHSTELDMLAEQHRAAEHSWVKVGHCHFIEREVIEYILDEQPHPDELPVADPPGRVPGREIRLRKPARGEMTWVR